MLRKLALLAVVPLALAACNSITGTQQTQTPNLNRPVPQCIDDLRRVVITHPVTLPVCADNTCVVTWDVEHVCNDYTSEIAVSFDGGRNWQTCGGGMNECSKAWSIGPDCAGRTALLKVTITDPMGQLVDINQVSIVEPRPRRHPGQDDE